MKLVFIAIPTQGTVIDGSLSSDFLRTLAQLHADRPDCTFIAPMIQDYQLLPFMSVTASWADWGKHCRELISRSDEVWVLTYDGFDSSIGVAAEIECANEHGKPVYFLEPIITWNA